MNVSPAAQAISVVVAACAILMSCGPDRRTEVLPEITCADCLDYDAIAPAARFDIRVAWTARCTDDGPLPDTSQTYACDEQPFIATAQCHGAACSLNPTAVGSGGTRFTGEGELGVVLSEEGDVELIVELEHAETGESFSQSFFFTVRQPDQIAIDCWWDSDPLARTCIDKGSYKWCETPTWRPCEEGLTLEPEGGTPMSIWVYGQWQGLPVRLMPAAAVSFQGFTPDAADGSDAAPHDDPDALLEADRFTATLTTAGQYGIAATFGPLSSSLAIDAR
jgi:hypothetical protein